ncbi:MAG: hypothetical protein LBQ35_00985 [Spirochaetaceae bacterium]|jgi:hypothetical protein|nr:hypothetical protein [Spirochaetaceae bacterium]
MKAFTVAAAFFSLLLPPALPAQTLSGVLDSRMALSAGAGSAPAFSWGFEEAANIRLQARVQDKAVFYGAVNLIAGAGSFAGASLAQAASAQALFGQAVPGQAASGQTLLPLSAFVAGENYAAALELERLYVRLRGEALGMDLGLMRIALGYGQIWGSSDFLNPRNPLSPHARPRAALGGVFSLFPGGDIKLQAFAVSPQNPFALNGGGLVFGAAGENHWERLSVQALYAYELPRQGPPAGNASGLHRFGLSLKADAEAGLVADALLVWNPDRAFTIEGLSAGAGFDYSFLGGSCYVIAEYLFNGGDSSTAGIRRQGFEANRNYLYALFRYRLDDYTSASLACVASLDDLSFTPILAFDCDLFQGLSLSLSAQVPLDGSLFGAGGKGEMGPEAGGSYASLTSMLTLKF